MRFLAISLILFLSACVHQPVQWEKVQESLATQEVSEKIYGAYPILQGPADLEETHIVVMRPLKESLRYFVKSSDQVVRLTPQHENLRESEYSLDHLEVSSLKKGEPHMLYVFDERGRLKDQREFGFLNPAKKEVKIFVASCMDDSFKDLQAEMWDQAFLASPDLMLFIGDNVYADSGPKGPLQVNPEVLTKRYIETRLLLKSFRQARLIPTFSIWDDHDFGQNNGGKAFRWKDESSLLFRQFFPQRGVDHFYVNGPGLSSRLVFKNFDVTLFDNRSFRTDKTHFGKEQEDWFFQNLNPKKLNLLVSGDQWFGGYHPFESYQGSHPESFKTFLSRLKKTKAPVIFVSGDRHLTELMKIPPQYLGRPSFEVTSSGIHARMYSGAFKKNPSPLQVVGVDGKANFLLMEIPNQGQVSSIFVKSEGQDKTTLFEKRISLK